MLRLALRRLSLAAAILSSVAACSSDSDPAAPPPPPPPPATGTLTFRLDAQSCAGYTTLVEFFIDGQSQGAFTMQAGADRAIEASAGPRVVRAQQRDDLHMLWDFHTVTVTAGQTRVLLMTC